MWLSAGEDFISGKNHIGEFFGGKGVYHSPEDVFSEDWPLDSLLQTVKAVNGLVLMLDGGVVPKWKENLPFPMR